MNHRLTPKALAHFGPQQQFEKVLSLATHNYTSLGNSLTCFTYRP